FLFISCKSVSDDTPESTDIFDKLQALQGVEVDESPTQPGFTRSFQITVTQPVDHNNPSGPTFKQTVYLSHKDESLPMIMLTAGYFTTQGNISELAGVLDSNHISMTHRYFSGSEPDPMDWQYLTIWQAASDHHRIVELFKTIYNQKWVNSGVSKSGMCAMFHRRFYPDDVDVTVAFAAPILTGLPDPRF
ncbi:MAG: peptidase, partial [bacterium]|nr:peptidase [bacterium]